MRGPRPWMLGLLALAAVSCRSNDPANDLAGSPAHAPAPAPAPVAPGPADPAAFTDIAPGLDALRARFQEDDGMVRVIMLVAPT